MPNFSLKSIPAWALGNMFMVMGTQKTVAKMFQEVSFNFLQFR
jgi:hypothetical protein